MNRENNPNYDPFQSSDPFPTGDKIEDSREIIITPTYFGPDRRDPDAFRKNWAPILWVAGLLFVCAGLVVGAESCQAHNDPPVVTQQTGQ